jgi:RimJ/RimL family protein N-acetyltransferase
MQPGDLDLVYGWLNRPHVARWWGDFSDRSRCEYEFMQHMESDWLFPNIALINRRPVGYFQYYVGAMCQAELGLDEAKGVLGIDLFIGDPAMLGKGFGTALLRQAVELLFREEAIKMLVTDPDPTNAVAVHVHAKVGFRAVPGKAPTKDGGVLMALARSSTGN